MPSFVRPRGSTRGTPVTPMSERQQMALLMQMTSRGNEGGSRSPSSSNAARNRDRNERGETPLHLAAIKGDVEQVCRLLAHRADPNVADFAGWTPLHEACNRGWHEVAFRLVQAGASVNAKGLDDDTPLHDAVVNGHLKLARMLVENGADVHIRNSKGKTPLDVAPPSVAAVLLNPNLPIPESSVSTRLQPRSRDDKKIVESAKQQKSDEAMETSKPTSSAASGSSDDVYEFKKESDSSPDLKSSAGGGEQMETDSADPSDQTAAGAAQSDDNKRNFADMSADGGDDNEDDVRRKKRKEDGGGKDGKAGGSQQRNAGQTKGQGGKAGAVGGKGGNVSLSKTTDRKSPVDSPKPASTSDQELEEGKSDLKVPPLKIVIPQGAATEQESGPNRNGKSSSQRSHQALPYVVPSSGGGGADGEKEGGSGNASPTEAPSSGKGGDEKKEANGNNTAEDQRSSGHHQRVLRSSHRSGPQGGGADRSSNNSSPQLQRSHSPSPTASPAASTNQNETPTPTAQSSTATTSKSSATDAQVSSANSDSETTASTSATSGAPTSAPSAPVELHPRKRKMRPSKDVTAPAVGHDQPETPAVSEVHPHEQPITNCYQLYLNIRKQIGKRRKGLFPVQPKPPQGFKDYLMNRCTYVLASTAPTTPNITYPATLPPQLKDLFADQEKERYKLRMQHVIEKEKLVLSVEQEILRVHGRAARALANQSLPFSVCTILQDEEVYNLITPEQEEKDRNARSRYNGRLFLSWLQDVDDKWEKIKEHMLLRHHNEAESLYAVQKMDWEWKMKELSLCDAKTVPTIDETHVPMVHVSDDFDLLPA